MRDIDSLGNVPRRGFLERLAAVSLAAGVAGALPRTLRAEPVPARAPSAGGGRGPSSVEDWPDVKGKHKQIFDGTAVNDGMPLIFPTVFMNTNNEASGVKDGDLGAVVVLRHAGIPIAFTDAIWEKYKLGEAFGIKDPATKQPALRNPFYHSKPGDILLPDAEIEHLQSRGGIIGVCNVALTIWSGMRGQAIGVDKDTAKKEWVAGLVPGVTILPSGVWGVNRAQEKGCTYCYAG